MEIYYHIKSVFILLLCHQLQSAASYGSTVVHLTRPLLHIQVPILFLQPVLPRINVNICYFRHDHIYLEVKALGQRAYVFFHECSTSSRCRWWRGRMPLFRQRHQRCVSKLWLLSVSHITAFYLRALCIFLLPVFLYPLFVFSSASGLLKV